MLYEFLNIVYCQTMFPVCLLVAIQNYTEERTDMVFLMGFFKNCSTGVWDHGGVC
jgi:hypothetical protein